VAFSVNNLTIDGTLPGRQEAGYTWSMSRGPTTMPGENTDAKGRHGKGKGKGKQTKA
jgi:hypothetical protein